MMECEGYEREWVRRGRGGGEPFRMKNRLKAKI